jgi:hypothetical protein
MQPLSTLKCPRTIYEESRDFALKVFISFSPGFSPVLERDRRWLTVLTVYLVQQLQRFESEVVPGCRNRKPLKRLHNYQDLSTGLKPGENEMKDF